MGNIFIADTYSSMIREVVAKTGIIHTVAGTGTGGDYGTGGYSGDGGKATQADLNYPHDVFVDSSGNIFIADTFNFVVREVVAKTDSNR
jgi:hypothetical protein